MRAARAGTSLAFADARVIGSPACASTCTVFSLSVNVIVLPLLVRLQPSGTFTDQPLFAAWYGTNTVLSGMSPGGFDSAGIGGSEDTGASVGATLGDPARVEGGEVRLPAPDAPVLELDEQPASTAPTSSTTADRIADHRNVDPSPAMTCGVPRRR